MVGVMKPFAFWAKVIVGFKMSAVQMGRLRKTHGARARAQMATLFVFDLRVYTIEYFKMNKYIGH